MRFETPSCRLAAKSTTDGKVRALISIVQHDPAPFRPDEDPYLHLQLPT